MGTIVGLLVLIVSAVLYFLPTLIAQHRGRDGVLMIALCNLLLGWTVLGWIVLLVVALTGENASARRRRFEELSLLRQIASNNNRDQN